MHHWFHQCQQARWLHGSIWVRRNNELWNCFLSGFYHWADDSATPFSVNAVQIQLELRKNNAPINVKPAGAQGIGWEFDCLCWPWGGAFDWSGSPRGGDIWIFLHPTWRYLTADSDGKDWDRTYVSPLPRFTYAPYGLKRSGRHGGQWEQAKAECISLFCLQISFVLASFWSIEPLKTLWYQSKRK